MERLWSRAGATSGNGGKWGCVEGGSDKRKLVSSPGGAAATAAG
jgi:hypothetical protein